MFAANAVRSIHILLVVWMCSVPIVGDITQLLLVEVGYVLLFTHWFVMNDTCALTLLEQHLRGVTKHESFMQSLVGPVYNMSDGYFGRCVWTVSVCLFAIGAVRLYKKLHHTYTPVLG